jgi:hypothetical protein
MPIVISCPNASCGRRYSVPEDAAGRTATCASCGTKIHIEAAGGQIAPEPPPPPSVPPPPPPPDVTEPPARRDDDEGDLPSVRRRPRGPAGTTFMDFFLFRWLITPRILIVLYWIVVVIDILVGLGLMASGFVAGGEAARILGGIVVGLLVMIAGPILHRILFEILIVVFRIYDTLTEIRDNTSSEPEP